MPRAHALTLLLLAACGEKEAPTPLDSDPGVDPPPVAFDPPDLQARVGEPLRVSLAPYAADEGVASVALTYTLGGGEGRVEGHEWSHTYDTAGLYEVTFVVTDAAGGSAEAGFSVEVLDEVLAAEGPSPADGASGVSPDTALSWGGGGGAERFDLYLSTDALAVATSTAGQGAWQASVSAPAWTPAERLPEGQPLYWRVDAARGEDVVAGPVWRFDTAGASTAPVFDGLLGVAAAGGDGAVQLTWRAGFDLEDGPEALAYEVFVAASAEALDWGAPARLVDPGLTHVTLDPAELPELEPGQPLTFAVRARDRSGLTDGNTLSLDFTLPAPDAAVLFVDDDAEPGGSGGPGDPFRSVQDAIDAAEDLGGGVVLIAEGRYAEALSTRGLAPLHLVGGLPDLTQIDPFADAITLLDARDPDRHVSALDGAALSSGPLVDLAEGEPVFIGGLSFLDAPAQGVRSSGAPLSVSHSVFATLARAPGGQVGVEARGAALALTVHGSELFDLEHGVVAGGGLSTLSLAGCTLLDLGGDALHVQDEAGQARFTLPPGGAPLLRVQGNLAIRHDHFMGAARFEPEDEAEGAALRVEILDNTVSSGRSADAVHLSDLGLTGQGGGARVIVSGNEWQSVEGDCIELGVATTRGELHAAVDISLLDNTCAHSDADGLSVQGLASVEGQETRVLVRGNRLLYQESNAVALAWHADAAANDAGAIEVVIAENEFTNGDTNIDVSVYGADPLRSRLLIFNNTMNSSLYDALEIKHYAQDDLVPAELDVWVGFNRLLGSHDASSVRYTGTEQSVATFTNNEIGLCDVGNADAMQVRQQGMAGGQLTLRNNVIAMGAGDGVDISSAVFPRFEHNTVAMNGRESPTSAGVVQAGTHDYGQTIVLNSIVYANTGTNLPDTDFGVQVDAAWSLIAEQGEARGHANLAGDPRFLGAAALDDFDLAWRLAPTSPAVDAGAPDQADPDGSPADLGAFGGPAAASVGALGRGASWPMEVIGQRPMRLLQEGVALPSGDDALRVVFTDEVDPDTVGADTVRVHVGGVDVPGAFSVQDHELIFTPDGDWPSASDVVVEVGTGLMSLSGQPNRHPWRLVFGTAPASTEAEQEPGGGGAMALSGGHVSVAGSLGRSDTEDRYAMQVVAGQRLSASTFAERLVGGAGEVVIELIGPDGEALRTSTTAFSDRATYGSRDAFLDHVFDADGEVTLVLRDESGSSSTIDYVLQAWLR